jgi:hypothetical protein
MMPERSDGMNGTPRWKPASAGKEFASVPRRIWQLSSARICTGSGLERDAARPNDSS